MHYRTLGRPGLQVSEIGYGAWGIGKSGWIGAQDQESLQALQRAIDLGVNFLDTALAYGEGHSEQLIGQVLRANRDKRIIVATKISSQEWPVACPGRRPSRRGLSWPLHPGMYRAEFAKSWGRDT